MFIASQSSAVSQGISEFETLINSTTKVLGSHLTAEITVEDIPTGYIRYSLLGTADAFLLIVRNRNTGELFRENSQAWSFEHCPDNKFDKKNDTSFNIDIAILDNLPVPDVNKSIIVTFEGKDGPEVAPVWLTHDDEYIPEPEVTWENHTLLGCFTCTDFKVKWDFENDIVTENITLYGRWEEGDVM